MNLLIFIIVLLVVVVVHEWGHFFAARSMKMRVHEFAFGFPPKLFSIKRGETIYSFNAIPLGGYVSIDGENGEDSTEENDRTFKSKSKLAQIWVLFAGPLMNIVLAFVLIFVSYLGVSQVQDTVLNSNPPVVILEVVKDSPAEIAGVQIGDKIYSIYINGDIDSSYSPNIELVQNTIINSQGNEIILEVERNKEIKEITIQSTEENNDYKIGVALGVLESKKLSFFPAIGQSAKDTWQLTSGTVLGFGTLFKNIFTGVSVRDSLMGPVGIAKQVGVVNGLGFVYLLRFTAMISISIGILNLMPLPALDGGRIVVSIIEGIRKKDFSAKFLGSLNGIGFLLLIGLLIFITIMDVIKLF